MADATKKILIPNTTQIPNLLLDFVIPRIPEAEARCLLYICRRTFGFHKNEDRVSFSQFQNGIKSSQGRILDHGTGLSRTSINKSLRNLIAAGAIATQKRAQGSVYRLNLAMDVENVVDKVHQLRKFTATGQHGLPAVVNKVYPQKKEKKEKPSSPKGVDKSAALAAMRTRLAERMSIARTRGESP